MTTASFKFRYAGAAFLSALLAAAQKAAKGDEDAAKSLPKLANCGACHKEFKKPK